MQKKTKLYMHKGLSVGKFALALLLVAIFVKTVLLPEQMGENLPPQTAQSIEEKNQHNDKDNLRESDYSEIIKQNPFGNTGLTEGSNNSVREYKTVSDELGLELSGTISGNPALARAVIKDVDSGVTDMYKVNQRIKAAKILRIMKDAVLLIHNGERKVLRMDSANDDETNTTGISGNAALSVKKPVFNEKNTTSQSNDSFRPGIAAMRKILQKADIEPYFEGDQIKGLQIKGIENISKFAPAGLKNGDVICKVNQQRLTSKQKAYQVLRKAKTKSTVDIELLRQGTTKHFSLNLN